MDDVKAEMPEADQVRFNTMLDGWQKELLRVGAEWGRMPAASAMLFIALRGLQPEVGNEPLAKMLEAVAGKVRAGEPITMKAAF